MNEVLHTKFGNSKINCRGYLAITSRKEGNNAKKLHRLMWEDFYGEIPEGYVIHHKNGNKLDNCILNLQLMRYEDHASMHHKNKVVSEETRRKMSEIASRRMSGKNNPMYGNRHSEESRKKMSESQKGRTPWNKGKKLPQFSGENSSRSRKIIQYSNDGTLIKIWNSTTEAGVALSISRTSITNCLTGRSNSAKNFIWKYKEN